MDGVTEPHHDESLHFQVEIGDKQSQWHAHTNAITHALAVTI
jgi:hypothetical protein